MARFVRTPSPLSLVIALVALLGCTTPPPPKPSSPAQPPPPSTPQKPSPPPQQETPSEAPDRKEETASAPSESAEGSTDTGREDSMSQPPEGETTGVEQQDPSASPGSPGAGVSTEVGGSAESRDELAALEQQLNESLAAYDEALAQQQEAMAEERTAAANGQAEASAEASGVDPSDRAGEASAGGASGGHQSGGPGGGAPSERDAADGEDVVARQLRKAAEAEKDPVLREKIWDEYRRYTGREPGPEGEGATPP